MLTGSSYKLIVAAGFVLIALGCGSETIPNEVPAQTSAPLPAPTAAAPPTATATATPQPTDTAAPIDTPSPTDTTSPTDTPQPTDTPAPAATAALWPTDTPAPTATPRATNTPQPTATPSPFGGWRQREWEGGSGETWYEVFVRGNQAAESRLYLYCRSDGYTGASVAWGNQSVVAQGTELKNDAGETWRTGHTVNVRFDDGAPQQETWWLSNSGDSSRIRQGYFRGAHPGFIQELRTTDTLTVSAAAQSGTFTVEFDVRNLDYALSQQPEHCREPDAYGKWVWNERESDSGRQYAHIRLYGEGSADVYLSISCYPGSDPNVIFGWGDRRPKVADDAFQVKRSDGSVHSTGHPVKVRYGTGVTQTENWQLYSATSRNTSTPGSYVGEDTGRIAQYQRVDKLTVATESETATIAAVFDVRKLDMAFDRLNRHCQ